MKDTFDSELMSAIEGAKEYGSVSGSTLKFACTDTLGVTTTTTWNLTSNSLTGLEDTLTLSQYFEKDVTYTFYVVLYVTTREFTSTPIENRATLELTSSSDFVALEASELDEVTNYTFTGTYQKYITAVNGVSIGDRSSYSNTEAANNPINVKQGDIVTYCVSVTNTSDKYVDAIQLTFIDEMQDGLELYQGGTVSSGTTKFYIDRYTVKSGETSTYTFTVKVTKSNMYLLPIENKVTFSYGYYWKKTETTRYYDVENNLFFELDDVAFKEITFTKTSMSSSYAGIVAIGAKDYVQLDDIEIAGDIWLETTVDGKKDSSEEAFTNVEVKLYRKKTTDSSWSVVSTVYPDSTGHYTFGEVTKGDTPYGTGTRKYADSSGYYQYFIEFEYNGVYYEATTYTPESYVNESNSTVYNVTDTGYSNDWNLQSHASESIVSIDNRTNFNNKFETIAYNIAYAGEDNTASKTELSYTRSDTNSHEVRLSDIDFVNGTNKGVIITARTFNLYVNYGANTSLLTTKADYTSYLQHMNLGLVERDQADIEIEKDVYSAEMEINGKTTTYTYNGLDSGTYSGSYAVDEAYELRIYNEDYVYRTSNYSDGLAATLGLDDSNDLQITLTYKITVTNTSEFVVVPREIIDISSSEMTLTSISGTGSYTVRDESTYNTTSNYSYSGYTAKFITGDGIEQELEENETITFYLTYSVNKTNGAIILDDESGDLGKVNIAQVGAFSAYTVSGSVAGVVDKDSNPGDVNTESGHELTDPDYYEDDTYQTSIMLLLRQDPPDDPDDPDDPDNPDDPTDPDDPDNPTDPNDPDTPSDSNLYRKITGNVWEDIASDANTVDLDGLTEYLGNGVKDGTETGAENILVKLYEVQTVTKADGTEEQYLIDSGIYTFTDEDGNYVLEDANLLHAGTYVVRFIYGDGVNGLATENNGNTISYSGQDYKSTTYTDVGAVNNEDEVVEGNAFANTSDGNGTLSFAKDNELRRLEVINYSSTITYELDSILKDAESDDLSDNTSMFADTKKFNVQIEYIDNYVPSSNFTYKALKDGETGFNIQENVISEVNFGLIERPLTILELADDITEVIAITSDGNELVHLYYDITYGISDDIHLTHTSTLRTDSVGAGNVQSLNRTTTSQGFRYVNIDTDILQGLTIVVKYQIAIANVSETDSSGSNLVEMVKDEEIDTVVNSLVTSIGTDSVVWAYNGGESDSGASSAVRVDYSFNKLSDAVDDLSNYTISGVDYYSGYFVGNTYYTGTDTKTVGSTTIEDVAVETRVDQIVDYIDTDAEFINADNVNDEGSNKFITYTLAEIATKGVTLDTVTTLLAGIYQNSVSTAALEGLNAMLTDGTNAIISYSELNTIVKNNAVFNVESDEVNGALYKYMTPTNTEDDDISLNSLYSITLQCSRTMTSEADAEGVNIENIAEIVKISNTVGRKVYVKSEGNTVGYIGNSSEAITKLTSVGAIEVAVESDTDFTEQVTLSPPTGLTVSEMAEQKAINMIIGIVVVAAIAIVVVSIMMTIKFKKKFYR